MTDIRNEPDFNALARDGYRVGISEFLGDVNRYGRLHLESILRLRGFDRVL